MSFEFPFEYAKIANWGILFYPIIELELPTKFGWRKFDFLVDTGADVTTVPSHLLPILNIKKSHLKLSRMYGVGGYSIKSWEFSLPIRIGQIELTVTASAVEMKDDSMPLLLGRKGIFESKFNLLLDSKRKVTILTENQ